MKAVAPVSSISRLILLVLIGTLRSDYCWSGTDSANYVVGFSPTMKISRLRSVPKLVTTTSTHAGMMSTCNSMSTNTLITDTLTLKKAATIITTAVISLSLHPAIGRALEVVEDSNMDDIEIAELPPVYVPIAFAIFILGGVGLLTSSLGDVYTEEASLGLMSGAKAKKEKERSRSSYFKNKQ